MSIQTEVLYGNRLYGAVTYSNNNDPETLTANLGDTASMVDADTTSGAIPLSDTESLADTIIKLVEKTLAESQTLSDSKIVEILQTLSDTFSMSDALGFTAFRRSDETMALADTILHTVNKALTEVTTSSQNLYAKTLYGAHTYSGDFTLINIYMRDKIIIQLQKGLSDILSLADHTALQQTKGFTDFILLQSWLRLDLQRANIWTVASASSPVHNILSLYAASLYGAQKLYAATPVTLWEKTGSPAENWGNEDGQNNQES